MACHLPSSSGNDPQDSDTLPEPEEIPQTMITFYPMDEIYVCADEALEHVMLVLTKKSLPPGAPPPAIIFTPRGAAQVIALLRNVLHMVEKHPPQTSENDQ